MTDVQRDQLRHQFHLYGDRKLTEVRDFFARWVQEGAPATVGECLTLLEQEITFRKAEEAAFHAFLNERAR
jgi:hypothetical protein